MKRNFALISQSETSFNDQADEFGDDLVGAEQAMFGGDRNTCGIKLKSSPWPKAFGAYRSTAPDTLALAKKLVNGLAPKTRFHLKDIDFNVSSSTGGIQLVFDTYGRVVRDATTGADTLVPHGRNDANTTGTSVEEDCMRIVQVQNLRDVYDKVINDANVQYTGNMGAATNAGAAALAAPGMALTGYKTTKTFCNFGRNTIIIELWDFLCRKDCGYSPLRCWFTDIANVNDAGDMPASTEVPTTSTNSQAGDPGARPSKPFSVMLDEHWKCLRKTRYLVRAGQSISHTCNLPSTFVSHEQIYGKSTTNTLNTQSYQEHISMEILAFTMGEICFESTVDSQSMAVSSCFLQIKSTWDFQARAGPRAYTAYALQANFAMTNPTTRNDLFPLIPNDKQVIISQNGAPSRVVNANEDIA